MKIFTKVKTIKSRSGELHFERWAIVEFSKFAIYIHKIHKADKDKHLHSHPWNFWSMILRGSYVEKLLVTESFGNGLFLENQERYRTRGFLNQATADRDYFHKIHNILSGPVYSLFITWGESKNWYYKVGDDKVESEVYRQNKNSGKYE